MIAQKQISKMQRDPDYERFQNTELQDKVHRMEEKTREVLTAAAPDSKDEQTQRYLLIPPQPCPFQTGSTLERTQRRTAQGCIGFVVLKTCRT
jgi:hypothetical protein